MLFKKYAVSMGYFEYIPNLVVIFSYISAKHFIQLIVLHKHLWYITNTNEGNSHSTG